MVVAQTKLFVAFLFFLHFLLLHFLFYFFFFFFLNLPESKGNQTNGMFSIELIDVQ
jgi:hypothetical protein